MKTENLVEQLRDIADDRHYGAGCKLRSEFCSKPCDDYIACHDCTGEALRIIADRIEREYLPRPRFEDGEPVKVGDLVLWNDGGAKRVEHVTVEVDLEGSCGTYNTILKRPVTDTLERIEEDARKVFSDYWGCGDAECSCCPAEVDGKKPYERYGTESCANAQKLDLLRRQREVLERGQE